MGAVFFNGAFFSTNLCLKEFGANSIVLKSQFYGVEQAIKLYILKEKKFPKNFLVLTNGFLTDRDVIDPWGKNLQINFTLVPESKSILYDLESCGPDGQINTSDDLKKSFVCMLSGECTASRQDLKSSE